MVEAYGCKRYSLLDKARTAEFDAHGYSNLIDGFVPEYHTIREEVVLIACQVRALQMIT